MNTRLLFNPQSDRWCQLYGSALALAIVEQAQRYTAGPVAVIVEDIAHADRLESEIRFYSAEQATIYHLPDWETLPYDVFSPHQDIISERLKTLHRLQHTAAGDIILIPVNTLLQRLCPRSYIAGKVQIYSVGQRLELSSVRSSLEAGGYSCVSQVMEHGEFTVRGSIIDLFPAGANAPYRIDLFDDEIETIRSFDPASQRSEDQVESIEILPAREFPTEKDDIRAFRERYRQRIEGDPLASRIYTSVSEGVIPAGIEYYLPLFFDKLETVFDYLPEASLYLKPHQLDDTIEHFWLDLEQRYEQRRHDIERPLLPPASLYLERQTLAEQLSTLPGIEWHHQSSTVPADNFPVKAPPEPHLQGAHTSPAVGLEHYLASFTGRTLLVAETPGRREILLSMLKDRHIFPKHCDDWHGFIQAEAAVCITVADIEHGLLLESPPIAVLTEPQIYGQHAAQKRRRKKRSVDADAIVRNLTDLHIGSPVVHLDHGIGRYLGLQKLSGGNFDTEFLTIEYARGDKLYVPVTSLHLISRYTGASPENAPVHTLGTDQWQKARRKAAVQARDVAAELLDIHARRAATRGRSYPLNVDEYNSFAANFPFEETPDQERTIHSVIDDLAALTADGSRGLRRCRLWQNRGRDARRLCGRQQRQTGGDTGADHPARAAALSRTSRPLCRLADPGRVLSRFSSPKQQQKVLDELANGKVDIVIGTHKLLQKSVKFADLGLVIIDEEHRFGVRHKEQLKALRAEVDILTLTATPIPRTLNMALAGMRDLSIIATPPVARHSIKTFVTQWNDALINEACQREVKRGGQIYFLHNEVETIEKTVREIEALVPEARVEFAHGQMPEKQLEQVMLDFYHQRFKMLVCTTIIESGIDVPTANTIIINRADKLGLAQLHQLRGRVGRSHHRAYAYLITPPRKPDDRRREKAAGGHRVAGRSGCRIYAGDARSRDPRRRRAARRKPERSDRRSRLYAVFRIAGKSRGFTQGGQNS